MRGEGWRSRTEDREPVSDLEFGNVNYKEGCRYIAANKTEVQCQQSDLRRILPTRQNWPIGEDAMGPHSNDEKLWHFPEGVELTDSKKRRVVAEVVAIGVKTLFTLHVYSFRAVSSTSELVDRSASGAPEQLPGQSWP